MDEKWGKWIIIIGVAIVVIGLIIKFFGKNLGWIGNLPGDIRIEKENFKLYFLNSSTIVFNSVMATLRALISSFWELIISCCSWMAFMFKKVS